MITINWLVCCSLLNECVYADLKMELKRLTQTDNWSWVEALSRSRRYSDVTSSRQSAALAVSKAIQRAAVTQAQSLARGEWAWRATQLPPPPLSSPPIFPSPSPSAPRDSSLGAGREQRGVSETQHPEDLRRGRWEAMGGGGGGGSGGGGGNALNGVCESEWVRACVEDLGKRKKSQKHTLLSRSLIFRSTSRTKPRS